LLKANLPNKYVDEELNCMKEIRKAYFQFKPSDYFDESKLFVRKNFEISHVEQLMETRAKSEMRELPRVLP